MTSLTKKPEPLTGSDSKKTGSQLGSGSFTCANLPANNLTLFRPWLDMEAGTTGQALENAQQPTADGSNGRRSCRAENRQ